MFRGCIPALITPMNESGQIDVDSLASLIEWHIESGVDGLLFSGTTGESGTLTSSEFEKLIRFAVKIIKQRVPVMAGTGLVSTALTIEKTTLAMRLGVDACLLLAPPYVKPTQEGLYQHFKAIAEAVPIPQIMYNVPGRTACNIEPETIGRLADIPNIIAIKDANPDMDRISTIIKEWGDKLDVLSGDDPSALELVRRGGKGVISVTANVIPKAISDIMRLALTGELRQAEDIHETIAALHGALFIESNPIPSKWALHRMGKVKSGIRLPLTWLSEEKQVVLEETLRALQII